MSGERPKGCIVPHNEAKGTDIFGDLHSDEMYIVRSDLGYYLQQAGEQKPVVKHLHPTLRYGDHYFSNGIKFFVVIKGDEYRSTSSLTDDSNPELHELHPNCRGGDHYVTKASVGIMHRTNYIIVFQKKGTFRQVTNLSTDSDAKEYPLHDNFKDGIYYWCSGYEFGIAKQVGEWGFQFHTTTDLQTVEHSSIGSFPLNMIDFLPGGLSVTKGASTGNWQYMKYINNTDGSTDIEWEDEVVMTVGHNKSVSKEVEQHWDVSISVEAGISIKIFESHLSLSASYGGSSVDTTQEDWSEEHSHTETHGATIKAGSALYLWQFLFRIGDDNMLFCKYLTNTDTDKPPTDIPSGIPSTSA